MKGDNDVVVTEETVYITRVELDSVVMIVKPEGVEESCGEEEFAVEVELMVVVRREEEGCILVKEVLAL